MAEKQKTVTRRGFGRALAQAGVAAAAAGPMGAQAPAAPAQTGAGPAAPAAAPVPNDQIVFGGIGIRNRGMYDLQRLLPDPRVRFVAIADIRESARESVKSFVDNHYKNNDCKMYRDPAEILARPDIDALLIATSDRWHGPMAMWAAQSGKDMYIEKPGAMSINESYTMADNVRRYGVVYQSGAQRKNQFAFEFAVGLARSGKLGRLLAVHADTAIGLGTVDAGGHSWWPAETPEPDPLVMDWDKWLGPCLWRPWNSAYPDRGRGEFWDFHAGLLEWASHTVAMAQWAADMEYTEPVEYVPEGPTYRGDGLIERYTIYCRYANGVQLILRNHSWNLLGSCSNRFEGTEGWVEVGDSGRIELSDNLKSLLPPRRGPKADPTADHIQEFLHCVRSRSLPRANAEVTCHTHVTSHAAWICAQLNRKLTWDPAKRMFLHDEEANRMRGRAYREPWRMEALATSM
jgi:predicted dehydrogenase